MVGSFVRDSAWRRRIAAALPALVPGAMAVAFPAAVRRHGPVRGYRYGFGLYWGTCIAASLALLGPRGVAESLTRRRAELPGPYGFAVTVLGLPLAGAVAVELRPYVHDVDPAALVVAPLVGTINAVAEELLWRAVPAAVYPDDPVRGWFWPAAGFTAWHLAPLSVRSHGRGRVLAGAAIIGLAYGWVAWRTGSVAATVIPHALTDSCGIRAAQRAWLARP